MSAVLKIASPFSLTAEVNPYDLEQPFVCSYTYDKGEAPRIFGPIDIAHPGWPACVEILSCKLAGVELIDFLSSTQRERLEDALMELHE